MAGQEMPDLNTEGASVNIVPEEEVGCLGWVAADLEELE